jgi:hypothetical protein
MDKLKQFARERHEQVMTSSSSPRHVITIPSSHLLTSLSSPYLT